MRWRIRYQLLTPLLTLLLGVVGVSVWTAVASADRARRQIENALRDVGRTLGEERTYPLTYAVLAQVHELSGADFLLVSPDGERLGTLGDDPVRLPPGEAAADDWRALRLGPPIKVNGVTYLCSGLRLPREPNRGDILYIFYPEAQLRDALWEAIWPSLVLGGSVGLASLGLTVGLGQRLSRRLRDLERRTRLIAAGDFSPMPLPGRDDEIRDLTRSVNEMAQRLAQFQETARRTERLRLLGQVSGGLAHQLRNGLAGARLAVQLFLRECAGKVDASALDVALRQMTLLETHLKRFLDLGRQGPSRHGAVFADGLGGPGGGAAATAVSPRGHRPALEAAGRRGGRVGRRRPAGAADPQRAGQRRRGGGSGRERRGRCNKRRRGDGRAGGARFRAGAVAGGGGTTVRAVRDGQAGRRRPRLGGGAAGGGGARRTDFVAAGGGADLFSHRTATHPHRVKRRPPTTAVRA